MPYDGHPNSLKIRLNNGDSIKADTIISTVPAASAAEMLRDSYSDNAAEILSMVDYVSMSVINFGYDCEGLIKYPGFGYLVPTREKQKILGVVYDSVAFPRQNPSTNKHAPQTRLTVMAGGAHHDWVKSATEDELVENALRHLRDHLQIAKEPNVIYTGAERKLVNGEVANGVFHSCIPQYSVSHLAKVERFRKGMSEKAPNLFFGGNSFDGIGVADCVANSRKLLIENIEKIRQSQ